FLYGLSPYVRFHLVAATLKGKGNKKFFFRYWQRALYQSISVIITCTERDRRRFVQELGLFLTLTVVMAFDFRILPFEPRLRTEKRQKALMARSFYPCLQELLSAYPSANRLILGNYWATESALFSHPRWPTLVQERSLSLVIVPHDLSL